MNCCYQWYRLLEHQDALLLIERSLERAQVMVRLFSVQRLVQSSEKTTALSLECRVCSVSRGV